VLLARNFAIFDAARVSKPIHEQMYVYVYAVVERTLARIINAGINPDGRKCIDGARGYRTTERTFLESAPSLDAKALTNVRQT